MAARRLGLSIYLVGGAVRDMLMGRAITDLDLVVEGDATVLAMAVAEALGGEVLARSQFGTAKLHVLEQRIDVVSARRETYRRPGALPAVRPGTIAEDLDRRDFTINAIALRLAPAPLQLLDPRDGQRDIAAGLVRILHSASFQDDATRILRAVRYEQRLGFHLEPETEALLHRDLGMLDTISGDRLRRELGLVLQEEAPGRILTRAAELRVLSALFLSLPDAPVLEQRLARLSSLDSPAQAHHYIAMLAFTLTHDQREGFIRRLNMPATWAKIVRDVALAYGAAQDLAEETSPVAIYRRLHSLNLEAVNVVAALVPNVSARHNLRRYIREWRHVRPLLNGRDLAGMGISPGPQVGVLLEALRDARLEDRIHTRIDEEAFVRKWVSSPTP